MSFTKVYHELSNVELKLVCNKPCSKRDVDISNTLGIEERSPLVKSEQEQTVEMMLQSLDMSE